MTHIQLLQSGQQRVLGMASQWTVARQLGVAFGLLLALMLVMGSLSLLALQRVDNRAETLSSKYLAGLVQLAAARTELATMREFEAKHSRASDSSKRADYEAKLAEANKAFQAGLAAFGALHQNPAERASFEGLQKAGTAYMAAQQKVLALGREDKQQDAAETSEGLAGNAYNDVLAALRTQMKTSVEAGAAAAAAAHATYEQARLGVAAVLALGLLLGVGCAVAFSRRLLNQLGGEPHLAAAVAHAVAEGDLTTHIPVRDGDAASLMAKLHAMQVNLGRTVSQVRQGSESVATASAEIAQGNQDLSTRTEQQASALQQTAATMDELGSTVRNNADNAKQANQLALNASTVAVKGGEVVGQVVETMKGINDSSRKISDIIGTIDGIAFQTNILALNAAVEAARAGEQGRGFAVVASEVRSLAQRSAEAAKEIKSLISASVERVEQGTHLVDQAGHTMEEIVASIRRVTDIVGEISSASVEQSSGVAQVGQAVAQMDNATQQNAALVEESAAAADSLRQQAMQLVQAVAVFKLQSGQSTPQAAFSAAPQAVAHAAPAQARAPAPSPRPRAAPSTESGQAAPVVERRSPTRAKNVTRPDFKGKGAMPAHTAAPASAPASAPHPATALPPAPSAAPASRNGTTDEWETF